MSNAKRPHNFLLIPLLFLALPALAHAEAPSKAGAPIKVEDYSAVIRLACVGDSITYGSGTKDPKTESYPMQLAKLLGEKWDVKNFGVGGATLLNHGDKPYQKQKAFKAALDFNPDVVVIMLGTNDTKPQNWKLKEEFTADYKDLIDQFKKLPSKPHVFVCRPAFVAKKGNFGINEAGVLEEIPMLDKLAQEEAAGVIDIHAALLDKAELIPDNVHPNHEGAALMAKAVCLSLTGK